MKKGYSGGLLTLVALALASLACSVLGGGALLEDDFSGTQGGWGTGTDADSSVEYLDGTLNFFVNKDLYFVWSTPSNEFYENIHVEATAYNNSSDTTAAFGVICNMQAIDTSYYFAVTGAGEYAIGLYTLTDDVLLTNGGEWGKSASITAGAASYRIGADCANGTLTLYVDGQRIDSVSDTTYTSGYVALFAWSGEQVNGTNVSFDDFVLTKVE
jgi:hypothetical protein